MIPSIAVKLMATAAVFGSGGKASDVSNDYTETVNLRRGATSKSYGEGKHLADTVAVNEVGIDGGSKDMTWADELYPTNNADGRGRGLGMVSGQIAACPSKSDRRRLQNNDNIPGAVIGNGVIKLGVNPEGNLNLRDSTGLPLESVTGFQPEVGLRYVFPDGSGESESVSFGCACEGWGAGADGESLFFDSPFASGLPYSLLSFTSTASTATSVLGFPSGRLKVTHDFHPSPDSNSLYEVTVILENTSGSIITDLRYRRAMDWDIYPTPYNECVTIQPDPNTAEYLVNSNNNGFVTNNPYAPLDFGQLDGVGGKFGPFTDDGPNDHGAAFQFQFGPLEPGKTLSFNIYYGAAESQGDAEDALRSVRAEAYSFAKPSTQKLASLGERYDGKRTGECTDSPNVYIFGFSGIGGPSLFPEFPSYSPSPSFAPSVSFEPSSSSMPSGSPTESSHPSSQPSIGPSSQPSSAPSIHPSFQPSASSQPSISSRPSTSASPSNSPTASGSPTSHPSSRPSIKPSVSSSPSSHPSSQPSGQPTSKPSLQPSESNQPSSEPSLSAPPSTRTPSESPTEDPLIPTQDPLSLPTWDPLSVPTLDPLSMPTLDPLTPTQDPLSLPTWDPLSVPTPDPLSTPTPDPLTPTQDPLDFPTTNSPTAQPSKKPTFEPSKSPTNSPTMSPTTTAPSKSPTKSPTDTPTVSAKPSGAPTKLPTEKPASSCSSIKSCTINPDPHFNVWCPNNYYDFQGGCDMIAIDNDVLQVQIRTRPRGRYSTITQIAVKIKETDEVFRLKMDGSLFENTIGDSGLGPARVVSWSSNRYHRIYLGEGNTSYLYIYRHPKWARFSAHGCEAFFGGSEGMCGSFNDCGVNYEDGTAFDISGNYWAKRNRATDLALSWQVPSSSSLLIPPSSFCDPSPICGGPSPFPCDAIDRRLQVDPDCTRTCDDIPIQQFQDQCQIDIEITGDQTWACQEAYTNLILAGDPNSNNNPNPSNTGSVGFGKWYVDWKDDHCLQDCDVGVAASCGGRARNWDDLYDSASACCQYKLPYKNLQWCLGGSLGASYPGSGKFYVDSTNWICKKDCTPGGPLDVNNDCGAIVTESWIDLYDTARECCQEKLGWQDPDFCNSQSDPSSSGTNKFYVIEQEKKCAQDCPSAGGAPCAGPPQHVSTRLYDGAAECCKEKLSWLSLEKCLEATNGIPSAGGSGSGEWYIDWSLQMCVKDCVTGMSCGGLKSSWEPGYANANACCNKISWVPRHECHA